MVLNKYNKIYRVLLLLSLMVFGSNISAQNDMLLHNFRVLPQSSIINPSYIPEAGGYFSAPGASSMYFDFQHTGFAYDDVFYTREDDSLAFSEDKMIKALDKQNYFNISAHIQPISFGFKIKDRNYISFSVTEKMDVSVSYPKDFMIMMLNSNDGFRARGTPADFGGFQFNTMVYNEIALGYSREIDYQWSAGIRGKFLIGQANLWTEKSEMKYKISNDDTSNYAYTATSDVKINASFPFEVSRDSLTDAVEDYVNYVQDNPDDAANMDNIGFAIDLGVTYRPTRNSTVSLSVLDLGYIDWKRECKTFHNTGLFVFDGYPINELQNDSTELSDGLMNLMDSIVDEYDLQEQNVSDYRTKLNTKIYFGGTYDFTKNDRVGALFRGEFFYGNFMPSFSLSYNRMFGKAFGLTSSYTLYKESYFNIGLGGMFTSGPFQMYLMTDNAYAGIGYKQAKNVNLRFGVNFLINKWAGEKDDDDRPRFVPSFYKTNRMINKF